MRPKDMNLESCRDILRNIEEKIYEKIKHLKVENKQYFDQQQDREKFYLDLFLQNNINISYLTGFKAVDKSQNLNIKW